MTYITFGEQVTALRKRKGFSQSELGKLVDTSGDIIGKYERNEVKPSIEVAGKIADVLGVSVDFLMGRVSMELDSEKVKWLVDIEGLPSKDREHIFYTIDSLIKAAKLKGL